MPWDQELFITASDRDTRDEILKKKHHGGQDLKYQIATLWSWYTAMWRSRLFRAVSFIQESFRKAYKARIEVLQRLATSESLWDGRPGQQCQHFYSSLLEFYNLHPFHHWQIWWMDMQMYAVFNC